LLIFNGGKVADQIVGYVPREVIEEKVNRVLASSAVNVSTASVTAASAS
jgi:hypothetical protein